MCRHELVVDATPLDADSVVGEECHIVSGKTQGPRHDSEFPIDRLDEPENLVLLCRVHHKMVDDQHETYTVEVLQKLKANHEKWVSSSLTEEQRETPVRVRRIKDNIPRLLVRLTSGRDIMTIVGSSSAFAFDHDEPQSEAEMKLLSRFLQVAQDYGDLWNDLEAGDHVEAAFRMTTLLGELREAGFWVFGGKETRRLEGGVGPPSPFPVAILSVIRFTNPEIVSLGSAAATDEPPSDPRRDIGGSDV